MLWIPKPRGYTRTVYATSFWLWLDADQPLFVDARDELHNRGRYLVYGQWWLGKFSVDGRDNTAYR